MSYCKTGEKPNISYKFATGQQKSYFTEKSPITVETKEISKPVFTGGQCPIDYIVTASEYWFFGGGGGADLYTTIVSRGTVRGPVYGIPNIGEKYAFGGFTWGSGRGADIVGGDRNYYLGEILSVNPPWNKSSNNSTYNYIISGQILSATRLNGQVDSNQPAFKGGQCECVQYIADLAVYRASEPVPTTGSPQRFIYGPIGGARVVYTSSSSAEFQIFCKGSARQGNCSPSPYWLTVAGASGGAFPQDYVAKITATRREDGQADNCGDSAPVGTCGNPKNYCEMTVKHNDVIIFKDQGECPCTFTVQCGDCPEGTIRCDSPGYPGYCCIPCAELAQRVDAMTRRLR